MTLGGLALAGFRHYRRTHAAVALGVAAAVAVMAGALLVGHSVRASLAAITTARLGAADVVAASETLFTEALGERVAAAPALAGAGRIAPVLTLDGLVRHEASGRRASGVSVYGVDRRFFEFHGVTADAPAGSDVLLSPDLAAELGAAPGEAVIVRVARPTDIPLDSLHGRKDETGRSIRLTHRGTLARESMGEFSLATAQGPVRAAFVPLARLQRDVNQPGRVNTLLAAGTDARPADASAVRAAVGASLDAADLGLTFRPGGTPPVILVQSSSGLIPDALATAVANEAAQESLTATPVLSWLANRVIVGTRSMPYSLVTGLGPEAGGDGELARLLASGAGGQRGRPDAPPPMVLNEWAARDLQARPGDAVEIEYYRWADEGRLVTDRASFRVSGVVPLRGLTADRTLAPDYPGITDTDSLADWTPPFPVDLRLVRPIDEDYWDRHRATPKAFIPLAAAQALWQTRYGQLSSLRLAPAGGADAAGMDLDAIAQRLAAAVPRAVDPLRAGIGIVDVRRRNLAASTGATDFGAYFFYFSFFLVVSAVLLAALFFRLSVEQRLQEIGLLRAAGFPLATVRRVFLAEGALVSIAGAGLGAALAVGWAWLMMYGLRTWWADAVGTTLLVLHVDAWSLAAGAAGGALAGLISIALTIRGLSRLTPRSLFSGATAAAEEAARPAARAGLVAAAAFVLAVALSAASLGGVVPAAGGFFGAGGLALIGGLAAFRRWLARHPPAGIAHRGTAGLVRLGVRNASWRPGRSLTAAALVAAAAFLLVSVDSFRKRAGDETGPQSGTGGFALVAEAALPLVHDPSTTDGLDALGLGAAGGALAGVTLVAARLRQGEDASCLNLYQPKQPRVVGVPARFVSDNRFRFKASLATDDEVDGNHWRLLEATDPDGRVPAILDATSLQYVFHAAVGDEITIDVESTRPVRLLVVASLDDTMLQGEILIAESAFRDLYPEVAGYRLLFVDVGEATLARMDAIARTLEADLEPWGVDVEDAVRRLEAFHRVENTYLSTFQTLGGLGLVLGSLGLVAIVLRNVFERRRELAVLGAAGFTGRDIQILVVAEHVALVAAGLGAGVTAALIAIAPVLAARGGGLPVGPLGWIAAVGAAGLLASLAATRGVCRLPLVASLRSE